MNGFSIGDNVIFVNNYLEENLVGETGVITEIYHNGLVQVKLQNITRLVLAKEAELNKIGS